MRPLRFKKNLLATASETSFTSTFNRDVMRACRPHLAQRHTQRRWCFTTGGHKRVPRMMADVFNVRQSNTGVLP